MAQGRIYIKMKKLDTKGNPVLIDGQEVIATFDPIHADNILLQNTLYWEVVDDPRNKVEPPKESREVTTKEVTEDVVEESTEEVAPKPKKRGRRKRS